MVAGGCVICGATVRRSILFSNVRVGEGSVVEDSLLLPNVRLGALVTRDMLAQGAWEGNAT